MDHDGAMGAVVGGQEVVGRKEVGKGPWATELRAEKNVGGVGEVKLVDLLLPEGLQIPQEKVTEVGVEEQEVQAELEELAEKEMPEAQDLLDTQVPEDTEAHTLAHAPVEMQEAEHLLATQETDKESEGFTTDEMRELLPSGDPEPQAPTYSSPVESSG